MRSDTDKSSYIVGKIAEMRARWFLRIRGFRILSSRYITGRNTGRAEIDIIARRGNLIIFCEVKYRPSINVALSAVTNRQSARLRRSAETYLSRIRWSGDARFDIITVCGRRINWVQGAI